MCPKLVIEINVQFILFMNSTYRQDNTFAHIRVVDMKQDG